MNALSAIVREMDDGDDFRETDGLVTKSRPSILERGGGGGGGSGGGGSGGSGGGGSDLASLAQNGAASLIGRNPMRNARTAAATATNAFSRGVLEKVAIVVGIVLLLIVVFMSEA